MFPDREWQQLHYYGGRLRECKINGKIVDPRETDGITYGSLMYQIESAMRQGYQDVDICAAIIKATTSKSLRGVLEARPGATIADITPALKAHFTVKGVKSVFHELGKGTQETGENALQFCMRLIGLRELVVRMNREEGGQLTPQLIQTQFQDSLSTGLRGELRHIVRGMLRVPNVDDNVLMKEITDLMLSEAEHEEKEGESRVGNVNAVMMDENNKNKKDKLNKNPLMTEISKISADVKNLSSMQYQIDELGKELKMQQRAFSMIHLTPEQKLMLMSEHPGMIPDARSFVPPIYSCFDPNVSYGQGYDPAGQAVNRGGNSGGYRGGYRGGSGRGGNHGGGYTNRGGGYNNRGGGYNNRGGGGYTNRGGGYQNRGGNRGGLNNAGGGIPAAVVDNQNNVNNTSNNVNVAADNNQPNNNNNNTLNNNNNQNNSGRGGFGGRGRGNSQRGSHHGFMGSQNFKCNNCRTNNNPICPHCFHCGEGGHQSAECPLN